jgi:hypothetical protein
MKMLGLVEAEPSTVALVGTGLIATILRLLLRNRF